ncbi:hypothetical protein ACYSNW_01370 [Enterococcus sp. LJL99]
MRFLNGMKILLFFIGLSFFVVAGFLVNRVVGCIVSGGLLVGIAIMLQIELQSIETNKGGK